MRIKAGLRHHDQLFLPSLLLFLRYFRRLPPDGRERGPCDFLFGYYATVLKNKIPPYEPPADLLQDAMLHTGIGRESNRVANGGRPTRGFVQVIGYGLHK